MTGPEHYREAERLLAPGEYDEGHDAEMYRRDIAAAQVHATLALAAATALPTVTQYMGDHRTVTPWGNTTTGEATR